ncbi:hypothetical protein [Streptomyces thermolilacinus]|uniref:Lipoprotein n=1 Tax=Streptomyces thermolilacinus SPC6 TaxID=1306406 RepID=A0A1D3DLI5_9ACTN|nr:hypothetical protein [Streptomyces thermolilacinus]OEJ93182.1 hypothetical protein J116_000440 [Streptomyces thermolilacinus SPC6]
MRTSRLAPALLAALLTLAGCTSVQGRPAAPSPVGEPPARERPPTSAPSAPAPAPASPREELAESDAAPPRTAASRHTAGSASGPADAKGRPSAQGRTHGAEGPGAAPPVAVPRPTAARTVQMRDLCQAARGTVDPSLAELCRRTYG